MLLLCVHGLKHGHAPVKQCVTGCSEQLLRGRCLFFDHTTEQ